MSAGIQDEFPAKAAWAHKVNYGLQWLIRYGYWWLAGQA